MPTYHDKLRDAWHAFEERYGSAKSAREVADFAVREGYIERPKYDPEARIASDIARALREEYATDTKGRRYRVNHAFRVMVDGVQTTLWASMERLTGPRMELSVKDRHRGIFAQIEHLKTDIDVFNDIHPDDQIRQLSFNFDVELEERRLARLSEEEAANELSSSNEPPQLH